ncbi:hypothetical protein GCM10025857_11770 [Alicyclobacillus contaminans]|nr:hypothetical protein GCM10025857_11770 [Alicyclobacillus contaminans]
MEHTGDTGLLDERVPYLHSEPLKPDETERYEDTVVSTETGTVLDHCLRAIRRACSFGEHGLPHMGIGDWNDGMNQVGARGRGESVWLGWFLLDVLNRFTHFPAGVLPEADVAAFKQTAERLQRNLNEFAWDGAWFRRAYTDAGTWLGSIQDRECRIDAIAQSWSVLSQGTSEERQRRAMRSFERELVDPHLRVARLLTPAFDETMPSPGYIQGYPPGIRENGGQYTHGVIWSIAAWAMLGARDKAHALFQLLNPITHTQSERDVAQFGNEPYVMTADIYTAPPHEGRGGWSWYTGAAGWMYQVGLESVLGVTRRGHRLRIRPCVPESWASFQVRYRFGATVYEITVHCQPSEDAPRWVVDGVAMTGQDELELVNDGKIHTVEVNAPAAPLETVG